MSAKFMAIIVVCSFVGTAALAGLTWAVVTLMSDAAMSGSVAESTDIPSAVDNPDAVDDRPFFAGDQLDAFFLDEEAVGRALGTTRQVISEGVNHDLSFWGLQPAECNAIVGLVDDAPAGVRAQRDVPNDGRGGEQGDFFQTVYQFAPIEAAAARFDEIAELLETCVEMTTNFADVSAEAVDHEVMRGAVNIAVVDVRIAYGFETESVHLAFVQAANVISTAQVWSRYAAPLPPPDDARAQLAEALAEKAAEAITTWSSGAEPHTGAAVDTTAPTIPGAGGAPVTGTFDEIDPSAFANPEVDGVHFMSPARDAGCVIFPQEGDSPVWGCTMFDKNWAFDSDGPDDFCFEAPISCGEGIEAVGAEIPQPRLRGDVGYPAAMALSESVGVDYWGNPVAVLAVGTSVSLGPVTCFSEPVGITCHHTLSGHGFSISRDINLIY